MNKILMMVVLLCIAVTLCEPLLAASDSFSVNFYSYGKSGSLSESQKLNLTLEADQSAGVGEWNTTGWINYTGTSSVTLTSTQGSMATFKVDKVRNYSPYYWTRARTTMIGDANADLMDGHSRGTESGDNIFGMRVSDVPFEYYDVIIYLGCCSSWSGDDNAIISFNGVERDFTVMDELFDGTFTEFVDDVTPCNYIVFKGVTGSSFTVQAWGLGPEPEGLGFNHIGSRGFQIMEADVAPPGQVTSPTPADQALHILDNADLTWTAGLFSTSSDVYFGTDSTPDEDEFQLNQTGTTFDPGTLAGGTYYWRIDAVNSAGTTTGQVWNYTVGPPGKVSNPTPYEHTSGLPLNVDMSWSAGVGASSYDIYFGTDPIPDSTEFIRNQSGRTFDPGKMEPGTTYYWRIDSVNNLGTTTGDVWIITTMPTPDAGRNTFLVPMPAVGASWKEFAFLAAVPASVVINDGVPSVIALDESAAIPDSVNEYLRLYNPANIYTVDTTGSLDDASCYLAQTFWTTTGSVVLCDKNDYAGALAASALAGRMEVPLMFFDSSSGLSSAALNVIDNDLQCSSAITVNGNSTVTGQLSGIGVSQTSLADDKEIITWMVNNGLDVEYLAVCNTNDRTMTDYAPKGSLAAVSLAAGRNGAVAALTYDTGFNIPFFHSSHTTQKPAGLPSNAEPPRKYHDSEDLDYDLGSLTLNGETHDFVIVRINDSDKLESVFIDFNDDGDYGDAGEHCRRTSEITVNGKRYTVGVNSTQGSTYFYGELRFTHPSDDELKEELQTYHDQIGHYSKYMAIVGMPQVVPCAHALSYDRGWCDYVMNDNYFADVDDDPLYEIATSRIVGEDVTHVTLNAARGLTYNDLQYHPASDRVYHQCTAEFATGLYRHTRQLENSGYNIDEWMTLPAHDYSEYGIFIQDEHGWPYGIARGEFKENSPWTVCLVEGGGCNMASLDKYVPPKMWYDTNAVVLAREGAVCFNAWVRGTGSGKSVSRDSFYKAILYDGASMGEAHLHALNIYVAKSTYATRSYDLNANMLYGDPAVRLHKPAGLTYAPANVTSNGKTLTVHAPEKYWVDYIDSKDQYVYTAPGLVGTTSEFAGTFFATYKTGMQITAMTQEDGLPGSLGWSGLREGKDYVIDEHWDNTRTIYWRVRFDEFNKYNGQFAREIDEIDYTVDFVTSDLPGDLDMNGYVDLADFVGFSEHWLDTDCDLGNSFCGGANIDLIDDVSLDDLLILIGNWLEGASGN